MTLMCVCCSSFSAVNNVIIVFRMGNCMYNIYAIDVFGEDINEKGE